ncbi:hypothetical protein [Rhodovulum kholense]|uniref:Uncharacterized protein n=1 Tax=Rhodovulum kholense TaxID=453584 RepID=A0A8E2VMV3_9RHOB|nr:hypothetical protein [Rhodovulum kholense]PTW52001.1 hypothetical protein C8N38_101305 [Rhodovulum kholense]
MAREDTGEAARRSALKRGQAVEARPGHDPAAVILADPAGADPEPALELLTEADLPEIETLGPMSALMGGRKNDT